MFLLTLGPQKIHAWPQDPKRLSCPVAAMRLKWNPFNRNSAEGRKMTKSKAVKHTTQSCLLISGQASSTVRVDPVGRTESGATGVGRRHIRLPPLKVSNTHTYTHTHTLSLSLSVSLCLSLSLSLSLSLCFASAWLCFCMALLRFGEVTGGDRWKTLTTKLNIVFVISGFADSRLAQCWHCGGGRYIVDRRL